MPPRRTDTIGPVKCDKCQANEATVHEVMIKGGKRHEKHLCEQCAKSEGMAPPIAAQTPITKLLSPYLTGMQEAAQGAASGAAAGAGQSGAPASMCAACGLTYASFRQTGYLGCPECYTAFEQQLVPLIARAHEGGTHHTGKSPRRPLSPGVAARGTGADQAAERAAHAEAEKAARQATEARLIAERAVMLQKRLNEAVAAEEYEKAAQLRDELARLTSGLSPQKRVKKPAGKPPGPLPHEPESGSAGSAESGGPA